MESIQEVNGWHFLAANKRLGYDDGRRVRVGVMQTYRGDGPIELCHRGMHGSEQIIDALQYAPGPLVAWCEYGGDIVKGDDKFCAEWRRIVWMADISETLHLYACDEAMRALDARRKEGHTIDPRSYAAIEAKRGWLAGTVSDADLSAAWHAAWNAAGCAAWSAAGGCASWSAGGCASWSAAESAAGSAAWCAARSALERAAWNAAWNAAWSAAGSAAESAAGNAAESAAGSAAGSAAWCAARSAQNRRLTAKVRRLEIER